MPNRMRIIRHEAVPDSGSFEVRFGDGRASKFFYWDDVAARRLRPEIPTSVVALVQAKAFARAISGTGTPDYLRATTLLGPVPSTSAGRGGPPPP